MFLTVSVLPLHESNTYFVEHVNRTQRSMVQFSAKITFTKLFRITHLLLLVYITVTYTAPYKIEMLKVKTDVIFSAKLKSV
jgi:hypothetical protein